MPKDANRVVFMSDWKKRAAPTLSPEDDRIHKKHVSCVRAPPRPSGPRAARAAVIRSVTTPSADSATSKNVAIPDQS